MTKNGHEGAILLPPEVDELCDELLSVLRPEFDDRSLYDITSDLETDFTFYFGFTEQLDVGKEAFEFAGNRGNRPPKQDGTQPRSTHVLARVAQPGEKTH
jgi:hypothetical protein